MNLYSNKQKWKIALMAFALLLVGASLFISNQILSKVGEHEKERAEQWADAIQKKIELVQLTNGTFSEMRENESEKMVSGYRRQQRHPKMVRWALILKTVLRYL